MRNFVHVLLDTGIRQYDGCVYWILAYASMTALGMTDMGMTGVGMTDMGMTDC